MSVALTEVYRIMAGVDPAEADFLSNAASHVRDIREGRPPRSIPRTGELLHMWSGVSVLRSEQRAKAIAGAYPNLGNFIARFQLPPDAVENGRIRIEKTAADAKHYTLWGDPQLLRACVQSVHGAAASGRGEAPA